MGVAGAWIFEKRKMPSGILVVFMLGGKAELPPYTPIPLDITPANFGAMFLRTFRIDPPFPTPDDSLTSLDLLAAQDVRRELGEDARQVDVAQVGRDLVQVLRGDLRNY